jgi:serine/threonine-protein kinase
MAATRFACATSSHWQRSWIGNNSAGAGANSLAADLHRFDRGEVIAARPVSSLERAGKWVRRHPTLTATLSFGLVAIFATLGEASWLIAQHEINRHAIESDLQEAAKLQRALQWSEARTALERARTRLGDRSFANLRDLLHHADRDQEVAARLDKVRSDRAVSEGGHFNSSRSIAEYEAVFRDTGLGSRDDDPALVASRVQASNIQPVLVSAVEDWAAITDDQAYLDWLLRVARLAAPDPTDWRERALTLDVWTRQSNLANLLASAIVTEKSVPLLLSLAARYERQGEIPLDLLTKCQKVRPDDFWANLSLGLALKAKKNPAESACFFGTYSDAGDSRGRASVVGALWRMDAAAVPQHSP